MLKPLNNHCLVEVIDEYGAVLRSDNDKQYQKGVLVDYGLTPDHITTSTGYEIGDNIEAVANALEGMKGKQVYWQQYADSGQVFEIESKKYALIPFYRLVGFEE